MDMWRTVILVSAVALLAECGGEEANPPPPGSAAGTSSQGGSAGGNGDGTGGGGPGLDATLIDALSDAGPADPRTSKVDLLFSIDNSISMADKQEILADTIPDLITRMATPDCVTRDVNDQVTERFGPSTIDGDCPDGGELEFRPVTDIHIGVISSSLGGHGSSDHCEPSAGEDFDPSQRDMAHLLTRTGSGNPIADVESMGFLVWDPEGNYSAGSNDLAALQANFADLVRGVGEQGCGFEAQLESVYRFLIDPDPYESLQLEAAHTPPIAVPTGTDDALLQERANFLRPDSLLAIFTITDENDCSIRDVDTDPEAASRQHGTQYYWVASNTAMPRATSQCAANANDPCCTSCALPPTTGCPAHETDAQCQQGTYYSFPSADDHPNVRCFNQQRRFGLDFLFPVERYIDGIQQSEVPRRDGTMVDNPIYSDLQCGGTDCLPPRDRSFIVWVGIVGVPWQDVAVNYQDLKDGLLPGPDLDWDLILGDPANGVAPTDPHMIESIAPRTGTNPLTGDQILPPDTTGWNPINGHERNLTDGSDLQYACIFPLPASRVCSSDDQKNCDCRPEADPAGTSNPLCQDGTASAPGNEQFYAKAYPSTRVLQVLRGLDANQVVVASICPANMSDDTATDYGYRPVVPPLMDRIVTVLVPE